MRYKAERVKTRCYQEIVGNLEPKFQGEGVVPGEYFWFLQNETFCYLTVQTAPCYVPSFWHMYRRVTDRRTDGRTDGWKCHS